MVMPSGKRGHWAARAARRARRHSLTAKPQGVDIARKLGNALVAPVMPFSIAGAPSGEEHRVSRRPCDRGSADRMPALSRPQLRVGRHRSTFPSYPRIVFQVVDAEADVL